MLYQAYQTYADMMQPACSLADITATLVDAFQRMVPRADQSESLRSLRAGCEVLALARLTHYRPPFGIDSVRINGAAVPVVEEVITRTPFCSLLRFRREGMPQQPRVLLVAPMSGHFATLLRGTVETMLRDHDVYITDWHNPRDIPLVFGRFGFDEYVQHLITFLHALGGNTHLVAVCQPTVAALAAVSLMAEDNDPMQPPSLTLMAGPIDARVNPTKVNELATSRPIEWFENTLIGYVPLRFAGGLRRVYPGFVQLVAFMSMNRERHEQALRDLYDLRARGEHDKADAIQSFYTEYFATMDLTAEFYLETVSLVFQRFLLAQGLLDVGGRRVTTAAIRRTALLTVEGERDDICAIGQTMAAQDLCASLRPYMRMHHIQTGVGHYGVFNGKRWESQVYPLVRDTIHMSDDMRA
ncbi:polyhydroxyalkanoate depolymerase [Cupriavidus pauculus]|uniref:polyhydroxyalkanoate depolymerase n=1 Tax=Cupriavidus pauculus TaxID=82633 RepID=UPI0012472EC6|nr:polyhydroxyalkanoate depolymerase [Cupriavidus pauculus]KAB0598457.1 polyhydroxyalkanoate depolymerase [Cupriavidus pauculus]MCM3608344.1 polyhydroxyalkanoate depolymerase [Cupriavidus pauculus]UAL00493.1 polyhydroxyalkanoate depolymerase [Cupriavidus pauculus]